MTRKMLSIVALAAALAVVAPMSIAAADGVNCRVPFSFVVNGKTMAPGSYAIASNEGHVIVRGLTGSVIALTMKAYERADGRARLVFLKTGDRYDLAEVWSGDGNGGQLPAPKRQRVDRRASNAPAERIVILADAAAGSRE